MGNDAQCNVAGIGILRHDGIVRTLSNVRQNPDLKHNLISLGTLETNGCKYSARGGVLKVYEGALVLMKGERRGSFYILQGYTVTGSAVVTTASSIEDHTQ